MIKIKINGVYTIDEAIEVLKILKVEETTDGVGFGLEEGQTETVKFMCEHNDYRVNYVKKDLVTLNIKVEKMEDIKDD